MKETILSMSYLGYNKTELAKQFCVYILYSAFAEFGKSLGSTSLIKGC